MTHAETNLLHQWSCCRSSDSFSYKPFNSQPVLRLDDWTRAWQWSSLNKDIVRANGYYCMPAGEEKKLSVRDVTKYFNVVNELNWNKFDEYAEYIGTLHYVKFDKKDWLKSVCNCWYWAKNYYCNHTIGLAVYKKRVVYKDQHKVIQIGQNRKRGQPKKTASALTKQDDPSSSSASSSDTSSSSSETSPVKVSTTIKKSLKKKSLKSKNIKKNTPKKRGRKPKQ